MGYKKNRRHQTEQTHPVIPSLQWFATWKLIWLGNAAHTCSDVSKFIYTRTISIFMYLCYKCSTIVVIYMRSYLVQNEQKHLCCSRYLFKMHLYLLELLRWRWWRWWPVSASISVTFPMPTPHTPGSTLCAANYMLIAHLLVSLRVV